MDLTFFIHQYSSIIALAAGVLTFAFLGYLKHLKLRHRGHPKHGGVRGRHSVYFKK